MREIAPESGPVVTWLKSLLVLGFRVHFLGGIIVHDFTVF